jgi:outer membrane protein OmpA-like peptidoglycan-associated protein
MPYKRFIPKLALGIALCSTAYAALSEEGSVGIARTQSAQLPEDMTLGIGLYNRLVNTPGLVSAFNSYIGSSAVDEGFATDTKLFASDHTLGLSLSGSRAYSVSLAIPLYYQDLALDDRQINGVFFGDLRLQGQFANAFGSGEKPLAVGLTFGLTIPTSEPGHGPVVRHIEETPLKSSIYSNGSRAGGSDRGDLRYGLNLTYDFTKAEVKRPFAINTNGYFRLPAVLSLPLGDFYNVYGAAASLEWHALSWLSPYVQIAHEGRMNSKFSTGADHSMFGLGGEAHLPHGLDLILGVDWGFNNDEFIPSRYVKSDGTRPVDYTVKGAPDAQIYLAVTWQGKVGKLDPDLDGIKGKADKCPLEAEDKDGFQDEDGCPESDNDSDGVSDVQDKCPLVAEDKDGFQDEDGCVETDNDNDSIADAQDKCPLVAEDKDGFEDADGCVDLDNDGDGVVDSQDGCPNQAQGVNGKDGCPFVDSDSDGVANWNDKCPAEKETVNGFKDQDGCADKAPVEEKTLVLQGVNFGSGNAVLTDSSKPVLDTLANQLTLAPSIKLEVSGHTDNSGNAAKNEKLSQARAQAVVDYLVTKGVAKDRFTAKGYGSSKPIGDNKTAEGKAKNRRVEFNRSN